jgi:1-pyrroline-5-carboxylate dehydrogenase
LPVNEPILGYKKGSVERAAIEKEIAAMRKTVLDIPLVIGGKELRPEGVEKGKVVVPHEHSHVLATYYKASEEHVKMAVDAALEARKTWSVMPLDDRMSIFMKAADLLAHPTWRARLNAATVLGQSKNFFQAEIDSACELIDFWRFNVHYAAGIYDPQPISSPGVWNRLTYRPLEGFVYAITPFNFTAIGGNITTAPAMLGNVVVWKPSDYAILSNYLILQLLKEAGLPDGVINFIPGEPISITKQLLADPHFAGVHYTGSTEVFRNIYQQIGQNINTYRSYPRIVGETGGKGFVFAHKSADVSALSTALIRGAFEFAGQKCSAASRAYIPASIWPAVEKDMREKLKEVKMGSPEQTDVLVNAVIHRGSFDRCKSFIEHAKAAKDAKVIIGGGFDDSKGYFIEPTVILTTNPNYHSLVNEIFGPILTIYVYEDDKYIETLQSCDTATQYSLTGSIFAQDREALQVADYHLQNASGNYYINDKPTGAVVGQQPFGGARGSGTNDKAGSHLNLLRWVSARTIKETFVPPHDVLYPYMRE